MAHLVKLATIMVKMAMLVDFPHITDWTHMEQEMFTTENVGIMLFLVMAKSERTWITKTTQERLAVLFG